MQEATAIWGLCAFRVHETSLTGHNLWFYPVPQRPNGNNVIARAKPPDNASFECLSLTFKNPVTICELPSYVTWRLSSQSRTPLALCISQLGKVNTGSYKLNKYSRDKQAHAMRLTVKLPRVHNVLIYVVNLQSWVVAQNTLPTSLALIFLLWSVQILRNAGQWKLWRSGIKIERVPTLWLVVVICNANDLISLTFIFFMHKTGTKNFKFVTWINGTLHNGVYMYGMKCKVGADTSASRTWWWLDCSNCSNLCCPTWWLHLQCGQLSAQTMC